MTSTRADHDEAPELRVVQLVAPSPFGGLETVVRQLSAGLARRGHVVLVGACLDEDADPDGHPFVAALHGEGIVVETIRLPHRAYRRERDAITDLLEGFDADVVHTHGYHADVVGRWAADAASVPRVATAHGFTGGGWKNRLYELLQRRSYRSVAGVIAVSGPIAEDLSRDVLVAPAVRRLRNGWFPRTDRVDRASARAALGLEPKGFVAGWVGRMGREKGPDVVLAAMGDPGARDLTLCLVGDGPMRRELEGGGAADGARLVWVGAVPDAGRLFAAFDVLILSSRTEGTPMVLLEAMDAGIPIVATRVGGVPDVVGPEEALLVDSEDPAALRRAVLAVAGEPEAARRRGDRAVRRLAADFSPDAWLDAHESLYRDAIRAGSADGREP